MNENGHRLLTDKLRRRGQDLVTLLRDPSDGSLLQRTGDFVSNERTGNRYTVEDNVIRLAVPEQLADLDRITQQQAAQFLAQGWRAPDIEDFRRLPQTPIPTWPEDYWANRAAVIAEMWRILENRRIAEQKLPIGPMGVAADLSDGMGWVGYGLDVSGYITVVVSPNNGPYGLTVFPFSRYLRVQADTSAPPLVTNSFDLVTVSFCLSQSTTPERLLTHAANLLKPNGLLLLLSAEDTDIDSATHTLQQAGLSVQHQRVGALGGGIGRTFKNLLGGPTVPPIIIGHRKS